jgi:5-methylcytosine-specific restriction endonuclease McrA
MNKRKAVCIERCPYSLVGGRWNRADHVPRQRPTQLRNRRKRAGTLPPSLESRVCNVVTWVRRLIRLCPIVAISQELVRFDLQQMENPEIAGIEYQQGTLLGYQIREYLLEKWERQCAYCDATDVPLEVEHLLCKARGGTNRVSNLTLACESCNIKKGTRLIEDFLASQPERLSRILTQAKATLKDAAVVNATRWALFERLKALGLPVECGSGGLTKFNRIIRGLPKTHWGDAACVGRSTPESLDVRGIVPLHITATGHGSRQMCRMDKYGFPRTGPKQAKRVKGFQTGDTVRAVITVGKKQGTHVGRVAVRASGSFNIVTEQTTVQGVSHRFCTVLQRGDGYRYGQGNPCPSSIQGTPASSPCLEGQRFPQAEVR